MLRIRHKTPNKGVSIKTEEIAYLDGEHVVNEQEPSTIPECVELIGEEAVVDETVSNLRYRNKYPRVYKAVSERIASDFGFPKRVKEVKMVGKEPNQTRKEILISDMDHIREFEGASYKQDGQEVGTTFNETEITENKARVQALFEEIAPAAPLYLKGERAGGGGKISQQALNSANEFFAAGDDVVEEKIGFIETMVPNYKVGRDADGNPTPESVARGIQALQRHLQKKAMEDAKNVLAGGGAGAQG